MSRFLVRLEKLVRALATRREQRPVRRILICHNLLLGDTILLAPLMKALATRYPDSERVLLVRPSAMPLFAGLPYGFRALAFARRDAASQRAVLRSGPYDLAIVPDDNRYAWLARAAGAGWIVAFKGDRPQWKNWMVDEAHDYPGAPAAWADMAVGLAGVTGVEPLAAGEWPAPLARPLNLPPAPYIVLHVGASTPLKLWPSQRWRALADELGKRGLSIVWSAGPGEESIVAQIGVLSGESNLAGRLDLGQMWQLLAGARLLVLPDTGVAHLARIVGVPTLALFGPGSVVIHGAGRFLANTPYRAVTVADFPCRDQQVLFRRQIEWVKRCGRSFGPGPDQCPHPRCMDAIPISTVVEAALELLSVRQRIEPWIGA